MPSDFSSLFLSLLNRFFSRRFARFCLVGASGVLVNLLVLAALRGLDVLPSVASATAIQVSIISNFIVHEAWTFRDKRQGRHPALRLLQFQGISMIGGLIQWLIFLMGTLMVYRLMHGAAELELYLAASEGSPLEIMKNLVIKPPVIGRGVYVAQMTGIAVATAWNFLANFKWTWGVKA